jgi:hypothetical protein
VKRIKEKDRLGVGGGAEAMYLTYPERAGFGRVGGIGGGGGGGGSGGGLSLASGGGGGGCSIALATTESKEDVKRAGAELVSQMPLVRVGVGGGSASATATTATATATTTVNPTNISTLNPTF